MTVIDSPDPKEGRKWRIQAKKSAKQLKATVNDQWEGQERVKMAFFFDDGTVVVHVKTSDIRDLEEDLLADKIYLLVKSAVLDTRGTT